MTISNGSKTDANDVLNIYQHGNNVLMGKNGTIYVPVYINNASGTRNVKIALWGKAAGTSATAMVHGASEHQHSETHTHMFNNANGQAQAESQTINGGFTGTMTSVAGGSATYSNGILYTNVPQAVQIWIDGSEYTPTIDDPNGKGATMYDSTNDDWGTNGTTAWDTGWLDLSSLISWTAGWHYIELKETGGTGGTLIYHVAVNTGF